MKLIAENLNEYLNEYKCLSGDDIYTINEGLVDLFMQKTNPIVRQKILYAILPVTLGLGSTVQVVDDIISKDAKEKIQQISTDENITKSELLNQIKDLSVYIKNGIRDEQNILDSISKDNTEYSKKSDKVKRKKPTRMYSLEDVSNFNFKDSDLKPNKAELKINSKGMPGYVRYMKRAASRGYNAPNEGYVNLKDIRISTRGISHIMHDEKYRNYGYDAEQKKNRITFGFGTAFGVALYKNQGLVTPYDFGQIVPERKCFVYFYGSLESYESSVGVALRKGVTKNKNILYMPQQAVDALVSICYNLGVSSFQNTELYKALEAGDIKKAAELIPKTKAEYSGVKVRRLGEQERFMTNMTNGKWNAPELPQINKELNTFNVDSLAKTIKSKETVNKRQEKAKPSKNKKGKKR